MTLHRGEAERPEHPIPDALRTLIDLIPRVDRLVGELELSRAQSTETLSLLRGKVNDLLWSGTVILKGASGSWSFQFDAAVPFASVGYVDSGSFGPFVFDTGGTGEATGPGTYTSFGGDSGVVPLVGRHLTITTASTSAGPVTLFLALFTGSSELVVK